jgi:hypothetical protein
MNGRRELADERSVLRRERDRAGDDPVNTNVYLWLAVCFGLAFLRFALFLLARRFDDRTERLSKRQTEALLQAWEDFDPHRNRPEPRRSSGRGGMWDEWLDGDAGQNLPIPQKNPRGHPRGTQ